MNILLINIISVEQVGDYCLHLTFNDGTQQTVDFLPFLARSSHPDIRAYLEPKQFSIFRIEFGELVWGDYALCFPVIDLYRNNLDHSKPLDAVA